MRRAESASQPETLLEEWLLEDDQERALGLMSIVVGNHAAPLIRRIVNFKLYSSTSGEGRRIPPADVDDVYSTALYNLLARFDRLKSAKGGQVIKSFNGYAAATAYNACSEYFRARKPAWLSLVMKLRYLTTHSLEFQLWQSDDGREICGFANSGAQEPRSDAMQLKDAGCAFRRQRDPSRVGLSELVTAILKAAGGSLILEELGNAVADWSGMKEIHLMSLDAEPSQNWEVADRQTPAETRLIDREYMGHLWKEILELTLEHRKALLLNLDDSAGGDIQLFVDLGIASIEQIAKALEMAPLAFAELWNQLPLDDATIASQMGLSRQDIANRRSSARKRLARQMSGFANSK